MPDIVAYGRLFRPIMTKDALARQEAIRKRAIRTGKRLMKESRKKASRESKRTQEG